MTRSDSDVDFVPLGEAAANHLKGRNVALALMGRALLWRKADNLAPLQLFVASSFLACCTAGDAGLLPRALLAEGR